MSLVTANQVGVQRGGKWLIRDVSLTLEKSRITTVIGPNGAGKTTLLKLLIGLMKADEGHIERRRDLTVGYVPQRLHLDPSLPLTVRRLMTLTGRIPRTALDEALERTGVKALANAQVSTLSGGEFQRVLLARALCRRPDLLVLDEPVQGVDFAGEIALYKLIGDLRNELGCGVLLISHDLHLVMAETDDVLCVNGHVCCAGTPEAVAQDPEYRRLFGARAADTLAVYRHHHDHEHAPDGSICEPSNKTTPTDGPFRQPRAVDAG
ncbi:MAG: zinc ABC transporter ATP-binding protein ZnuC [Pseudomonadota bacterium]